MDFLQAILLGILQGVFEWLPVSSEAVVTIVMTQLYGSAVEESVNTAIWLHTGTMLAALLYFRERFRQLVVYTIAAFRERTLPIHPSTEEGRLTYFIAVTTAVTAAFGGALYFVGIETVANYPGVFTVIMAAALAVTGILRLYTNEAERTVGAVNATDSAFIGVLQGMAIIPGISRSGSTVFGLLYRDFSAEDAFVLSFLLSVPAVFIANIGINLFGGFELSPHLVVAAITSAVVGYLSIGAVLKVAGRTSIAYLCFILAAISLLPVLL